MAATDTTRFICLFHDADRGRSALDALARTGISRDAVTVLGDAANTYGDYNTATLDRLGIPERDLDHLRKGVENGGVLVALDAPESRSHDIEGIFHKYSADKIDEAEAGSALAAASVSSGAATRAEGVVVPVVQEDLLVGKREVDRGGVRVLRRTVEEPVNEAVNLHEERVVIDRRPADRAVSQADMVTAGQVIELTETAEVPVVTKTSRVVEEVRVGLQTTDRTQTVKDTVRHTEVDVEPIPAANRTTPRR